MALSTMAVLPVAVAALAAGALSFAAGTTESPDGAGAPAGRWRGTVMTGPRGETPARGEAGAMAPGSSARAEQAQAGPGQPAGPWAWPLVPRPRVLRPFIRPRGRYGAGHRGIDLAGRAGAVVRAVDAGRVAHIGLVAGRGTVSVLHASGLRSTYEPVSAGVTVGQVVQRGAALGQLSSDGSHCAPDACLHLGAIRGTEYVDPLLLLERSRVRLLPLR